MTNPCLEFAPYLEPEPDLADAAREHAQVCAPCAEEGALDAWAGETLRSEQSEPILPDALRASLLAKASLELAVANQAAGVAAAGASPAATTPHLVRIHCTFCHDGLGFDRVYCAGCIAPHHADCFQAHGQCSATGCDETRWVSPQQIEKQDPAPVHASPARWKIPTMRPQLRWAGAAATMAWLALGLGVGGLHRELDQAKLQLDDAERLLAVGRNATTENHMLIARGEALRERAASLLEPLESRALDRRVWEAAARALGQALPKTNDQLPGWAPGESLPIDALRELEQEKTWLIGLNSRRTAPGVLQIELQFARAVRRGEGNDLLSIRSKLKHEVIDSVFEELTRAGLSCSAREVGVLSELYGLSPDERVDDGRQNVFHLVTVDCGFRVEFPRHTKKK